SWGPHRAGFLGTGRTGGGRDGRPSSNGCSQRTQRRQTPVCRSWSLGSILVLAWYPRSMPAPSAVPAQVKQILVSSHTSFYYTFRSLEARWSRSQSPNRLKDNTVNMMATPGNIETHHAVTINSRPSAIMRPHAGMGRGSPAPRKLRVDSRRMTYPTWRVAKTTSEFTTLGKI